MGLFPWEKVIVVNDKPKEKSKDNKKEKEEDNERKEEEKRRHKPAHR